MDLGCASIRGSLPARPWARGRSLATPRAPLRDFTGQRDRARPGRAAARRKSAIELVSEPHIVDLVTRMKLGGVRALARLRRVRARPRYGTRRELPRCVWSYSRRRLRQTYLVHEQPRHRLGRRHRDGSAQKKKKKGGGGGGGRDDANMYFHPVPPDCRYHPTPAFLDQRGGARRSAVAAQSRGRAFNDRLTTPRADPRPATCRALDRLPSSIALRRLLVSRPVPRSIPLRALAPFADIYERCLRFSSNWTKQPAARPCPPRTTAAGRAHRPARETDIENLFAAMAKSLAGGGPARREPDSRRTHSYEGVGRRPCLLRLPPPSASRRASRRRRRFKTNMDPGPGAHLRETRPRQRELGRDPAAMWNTSASFASTAARPRAGAASANWRARCLEYTEHRADPPTWSSCAISRPSRS